MHTFLRSNFIWFPGLALTLVLAAQFAYYYVETPTTVVHASWRIAPKSFPEARKLADQGSVLVRVMEVGPGKDIVTDAPGEPGGFDSIPTQNIVVEVTKVYEGRREIGEHLVLFQTGGLVLPDKPNKKTDDSSQLRTKAAQMILEGDPLYRPGEIYLLLLTDGPQEGLLRPISPEGRYLIDKSGLVKPMVRNAMTKSVFGQRLAVLEKLLIGEGR